MRFQREKVGSLTDVDLMEKLMQASCAGVQIKMFVREICCLLPGIEGKTEHIQVFNIVGRFLEHSRVYCFGTGSDEKMYISSADFMTRNTERRVEVARPIYDDSIRKQIHDSLEMVEYENVKARVLLPNGNYVKNHRKQAPIDSQLMLRQKAIERSRSESNYMSLLDQIAYRLKHFFHIGKK